MVLSVKGFLQWGGIILILLGILGILVPEIDRIVTFWPGENWAHLILGVAALVVRYALPEGVQKVVVVLVGLLALYVGIAGFAVAGRPAPNYLGVNLDNPVDNILHLVVGVWALWAAYKKAPEGEPMMPAM